MPDAFKIVNGDLSGDGFTDLEPDEPAGYYIEEIIEGNTVCHSLAAVQYDENELKRKMKAQMDEAIKSDRMKPSEAMRLLDDYERGLKAYTYLSF